jgi:hypothetical protein
MNLRDVVIVLVVIVLIIRLTYTPTIEFVDSHVVRLRQAGKRSQPLHSSTLTVVKKRPDILNPNHGNVRFVLYHLAERKVGSTGHVLDFSTGQAAFA